MNERIQELILEAGFPKFDKMYVVSDGEELNKFAELIVRECMRMCEVTEMAFETHHCSVEASGAITVKQYIAEHFEVE